MKYKPEDIKPKRYPDKKPSGRYFYWFQYDNHWREAYSLDGEDMFIDNSKSRWWVPIPGAPPELKPLKYPENKPDEYGEYLAHDKNLDEWLKLTYSDREWWKLCNPYTYSLYRTIDWYIPYRLDKENDMDVIWEIPERYCEAGLKLILNQGNDREKFRYLLMVMINNDYEVGSKLNDDEVDSLLLKLGNHAGYEVTRKPEIKACPNPECEGRQEHLKVRAEKFDDLWEYQILCEWCGVSGAIKNNYDEAIEAWNALPRKGE